MKKKPHHPPSRLVTPPPKQQPMAPVAPTGNIPKGVPAPY